MHIAGQGVSKGVAKATQLYEQAIGLALDAEMIESVIDGAQQQMRRTPDQKNKNLLNRFIEKSYDLLAKSYKKNYPSGQSLIKYGEMFLAGKGVERDVDMAIDCFEGSVADGCIEGLCRLAEVFESPNPDREEEAGVYIRPNKQKSLHFYDLYLSKLEQQLRESEEETCDIAEYVREAVSRDIAKYIHNSYSKKMEPSRNFPYHLLETEIIEHLKIISRLSMVKFKKFSKQILEHFSKWCSPDR